MSLQIITQLRSSFQDIFSSFEGSERVGPRVRGVREARAPIRHVVSGMTRMQVRNLKTILPLRVRFRFARKIYTKKIPTKNYCYWIDQFRYIKIHPKIVNLSRNIQGSSNGVWAPKLNKCHACNFDNVEFCARHPKQCSLNLLKVQRASRVINTHYVFLFVVLLVDFYSFLEEESLDEVKDEGISSSTFGWTCHVMPVR